MERKAFQTWLSAIDTLSAAQKTEVGEVLAGRPVGEAFPGGRRVECWRRPVLSPLRHARCGGQRQGAGNAALSLPIVQENLRRGDGDAAERPAPQGCLADVRRMPCQWRHGSGFGEALWHRREYRLSLAAPLPRGDRDRHRKAAGHCRSR